MKNITIALLAIISFASCTKPEAASLDATACYTCTSKMTILNPQHDSTSVVNYCGKTPDEIKAIQTAGCFGDSYMYSYTTCKKD